MPTVVYTHTPNPKALQLVTGGGNYTILSGEYARVTFVTRGTGTGSLNGTGVAGSSQNTVLASSNIDYGNYSNSAGGSNIDFLYTGNAVSTTNAGDPVKSGEAFTSSTNENIVSVSYNVPTGTLIAVSGNCAAVIERYDE